MAGEDVKLLIEVATRGQEQIREINKDLSNLTKTTEVQTEVEEKSVDTKEKSVKQLPFLNKQMSSQIPILKDLKPLISSLGLGWLGAATAATALTTAGVMSVGTFNDTLTGLTGLVAKVNQYTQANMGLEDVYRDVDTIADKYNVTEQSVIESLNTIIPKTHDYNTAIGILTEALSLHEETGISVKDAVDLLSDAYENGAYVQGQYYAAGDEAMNKLKDSLLEGESEIISFKTKVDNEWSATWETFKLAAGSGITAVFTAVKWFLSNALAPLRFELEMIQDLLQGDWGGALDNFKESLKAMSNPFGGILGDIGKGLGQDIKDSVWDTITGSVKSMIKFNIPGFASGTESAPGGMAIVGEEGPELLNLPKGSEIIPHKQSMEIINGSKGGNINDLLSGMPRDDSLDINPINNHASNYLSINSQVISNNSDVPRNEKHEELNIYIDSDLLANMVIDKLNTNVRLRGAY